MGTGEAEQRRRRRDSGHGPAVGDPRVGHGVDRCAGTRWWRRPACARPLGNRLPPPPPHTHLISVQGMLGTYNGRGRLGKAAVEDSWLSDSVPLEPLLGSPVPAAG